MKRMLMTWLLAMLAGAASLFAQDTENGHKLTGLWKEYEKVSKADLPQKEAAVLARIKEEAQRKHLPADFYDAATAYVNCVRRRDWKQRDALLEALAQEMEAFNDPLVTFLWMAQWKYASNEEMKAYVLANPEGFQGCNRALHRGVDGYLNGSLKPFIRTDREYALWYLWAPELQAEVAGTYPNEAAWAYESLNRRHFSDKEREQELAAWQALADQYANVPFGVYPQAELLRLRFARLNRENAGSDAYQALYADVAALEKQRKSYVGEAQTLTKGCTYPASLAESLTSEDLWLRVADGQIQVIMRNLPKASVTLREGKKTLHSWNAVNPTGSFYVQDTVSIPLPTLPDGDYSLEGKNGKILASESYTQYQLSIATRSDSRGRCVYVAYYDSGVPLQKVKLILCKNGKEVASTTLKQDGFTPLPQAFVGHMDGSRASWQLQAQSGAHKSRKVYLNGNATRTTIEDHVRCNIYKDRGAYNPGDTLQFKAIVFDGDPARSLQVVKEKAVEVRLRDSEDNVVETLGLTTNGWGSVSGRFVIPTGHRGGRWELEAVGLGYDWFRVDEFVLPTFDLAFDALEQLYLTGADVPVSGRLISYSGHNLSGAHIGVKVSRNGSVVLNEEEVPLLADNRFQTSFKATESGYYRAEVTVTEATGETHSYSQGWYIGNRLQVSVRVKNEADAELKAAESPNYVVSTPSVQLQLQSMDGSGNPVPLKVQYALSTADGKLLAQGETHSGDGLSLSLPGDGLYLLKATTSATDAEGKTVTGEQTARIFCVQPSSDKLGKEVKRIFIAGPLSVAAGKKITARVGSAEGDAWTIVTLYGENRQVLYSQPLRVQDGTLENISLPYKDAYPQAVRLQVFYFIHGNAVTYEREYRREADRYVLPLQFTRFQDKAYPGTEYSFCLKTQPGTEVLVAAWDKSIDAIETNDWPLVSLRDFGVESVHISSICGRVGGEPYHILAYGRTMAKSAAGVNMAVMADAALPEQEEAIPFQLAEQKPSFGTVADVDIREKFASALTFQPHLKPAADGSLPFSFRTSDKLSTYYIRVYAHDKAMHNAVIQQEMVVSLPVKVSLLEPRYLYAGDRYEALVTVSSIADEPVTGTLLLQVNGTLQQVQVTVPAGKTVSHSFTEDVPSGGVPPEGASSLFLATEGGHPSEGISMDGTLTMTAAFKAAEFSDAVRVKVPVYPAAQQLTEAHSAVLRDGMDREALLADLRSRFVNVPASQAALREITVLDMVRDAIPQHVEPRGNDVLSLSEAWYVQLMAAQLSAKEGVPPEGASSLSLATEGGHPSAADELLERILACRNADGGFGWFEGMNSSPVITAVLLERFAKLRSRGFEVPDVTSSVKYLDKLLLGQVRPAYYGWLSDDQYVFVRSMYAYVPFQEKAVSAAQKKRFAQFAKDVKNNLVPSKKAGRGLKGQILAKARRVLTLRNLVESEDGMALAKAWGVTLGSSAKLKASIKADIASLLEYAVEHRDGGWYYPNAVMPWRGLLESEAYAHALICDLFAVAEGDTLSSASLRDPVRANATERVSPSAIADGIRLWLMLQKETQKWEQDPSFIDAITAILDGSRAVLNTRVLALSATYEAPFASVKASGNGFTVARRFFRDGKEIQPGEEVTVGDRITVKYEIWNAENRSFVKLTAGREASLSPVQQLSGLVSRSGYRHVKASVTEYYFDSYPEEKTTLTEDFFVVQSGAFQAPVTVIESLYAPHYRANAKGCSAGLVCRRQ